jgi:hypothetical protein
MNAADILAFYFQVNDKSGCYSRKNGEVSVLHLTNHNFDFFWPATLSVSLQKKTTDLIYIRAQLLPVFLTVTRKPNSSKEAYFFSVVSLRPNREAIRISTEHKTRLRESRPLTSQFLFNITPDHRPVYRHSPI